MIDGWRKKIIASLTTLALVVALAAGSAHFAYSHDGHDHDESSCGQCLLWHHVISTVFPTVDTIPLLFIVSVFISCLIARQEAFQSATSSDYTNRSPPRF